MRQREVLPGPVWPAAVLAAWGVAVLLFNLWGRQQRWFGVALGVFLLVQAAVHFASRDTVLDERGIKPAGSLRQRIAWAQVRAVEQSKTARHYPNVAVTVAGRKPPLHLRERRGGRDLATVHRRRLQETTGAGAAGSAQAAATPDPA